MKSISVENFIYSSNSISMGSYNSEIVGFYYKVVFVKLRFEGGRRRVVIEFLLLAIRHG